MLDCKWIGADGRNTNPLDVPRILEHIIKWMLRVGWWNVVIMLPRRGSATDILKTLSNTNGYEDIVVQEGTYTLVHFHDVGQLVVKI